MFAVYIVHDGPYHRVGPQAYSTTTLKCDPISRLTVLWTDLVHKVSAYFLA